MKFMAGFLWVFLSGIFLYFLKFPDWVWILSINFCLQLSYLLIFWRPYKSQQLELTKPILMLIILQVMAFLAMIFIYVWNDWHINSLVSTLFVFYGALIIQVFEQVRHLKSLEKTKH